MLKGRTTGRSGRCTLIQTLIKNWWLLALCGVLYAIISATYLMHYMQDRGFHVRSTIVFLGELALAAGACTITAGIWRSAKGKCWLLVLNGLALGALGLTLTGIFRHSISFGTVALLIILMAMSIGIFELVTARTLRRHWNCSYDESGNIGRRYRRQDEVGTPWCVTFDFDSLEDGKVTLRDRDSMDQERLPIGDLVGVVRERLESAQ